MEYIYLFNDDISVLQTFMFGQSEISIIHRGNRTENRSVVQQKIVENTIKYIQSIYSKLIFTDCFATGCFCVETFSSIVFYIML